IILDDYPKCFIVGSDNVGSKQMQQIHMSLHGKVVVLIGKNTMMPKAIQGHLENNPALDKLFASYPCEHGCHLSFHEKTSLSQALGIITKICGGLLKS
uniref:Large ribosomal subunit protein uL10 n=1 Tax=Anolis carolinensis TaxID=28377 RepID=A0A803TB62_ANOCA